MSNSGGVSEYGTKWFIIKLTLYIRFVDLTWHIHMIWEAATATEFRLIKLILTEIPLITILDHVVLIYWVLEELYIENRE